MSKSDGIEIQIRHRPIISPIIIETDDGPTTTLRWRGTDETRTLHGATWDEIDAAVRAWEAERALPAKERP